eukprot:6440216-Pyramimonas_sp.AAC.1
MLGQRSQGDGVIVNLDAQDVPAHAVRRDEEHMQHIIDVASAGGVMVPLLASNENALSYLGRPMAILRESFAAQFMEPNCDWGKSGALAQ